MTNNNPQSDLIGCHQCGATSTGNHCQECTALLPERRRYPEPAQAPATWRFTRGRWVATVIGVSVCGLTGWLVISGLVRTEAQEHLVEETAQLVDTQLLSLQQAGHARSTREATAAAPGQLATVTAALHDLPPDDDTREELMAFWLLLASFNELHTHPKDPDWKSVQRNLRAGLASLPGHTPRLGRIRSLGVMLVEHLTRKYEERPLPSLERGE